MKIEDLKEAPIIDVDYKKDLDGSEGSFMKDTNKVRNPKWRQMLIGKWAIPQPVMVHFLETDKEEYDKSQEKLTSKHEDKGLSGWLGGGKGYGGEDVERMKKNFGYNPNLSVINFVSAGNTVDKPSDVKRGFSHFLSPWILAHRFGHAADTSWSTFIETTEGYDILADYHQTVPLFSFRGFRSAGIIVDIYEIFGNTRAIRTNAVGINISEVYIEMFASYIVLGRIALHEETPEEVKKGFSIFEEALDKWLDNQIGKTWVL
jgi:hypothetical protein